ncbi:MAG: 2Fe-2S iron-sulfur cluster binding domain-containing protein [Alteromonadaceae bacterium]|nr:2Fe-2S iron-sulfur cluster binding domain-containing protein [Alteromonadaceae bacterium]
MIKFTLNGESVSFDGDPQMPLLWFVRDIQNMTGSKFGCGVGMCGACTMHLNGAPIRSCSTPVSVAQGATVTTIEGLASAPAKAVQEAWQKLDVVQCGYCQSGQIMSATALLEGNAKPTDADINMAMQGNICRCATYHRIRAAIHDAADRLAKEV